MTKIFALALVLLSPIALADDGREAAAEKEITKLIDDGLLGHYEVELVSVLGIKDRTGEWGGFKNGYGLITVTARFVAVRNARWSEHLNRTLAAHCEEAGSVYVLCQPEGHEFSGNIEVDMAHTTDGWKVLNRNSRNLREFVLSGYLLLEGRPEEGYVLPRKSEAR